MAANDSIHKCGEAIKWKMIVIVCVAPYEWELFRRYHCNELLFSVISSFFSVARFALFYVLSIAVAVAVYQIFHFVCGRHSKSSFENSSVTGIFSSICSVLSGFIFFLLLSSSSSSRALENPYIFEKKNKINLKIKMRNKNPHFSFVYTMLYFESIERTLFLNPFTIVLVSGIWRGARDAILRCSLIFFIFITLFMICSNIL